MLNNVSIIIPIAPNETAHALLLKNLETTEAEIIVSSEGSRAKSLNAGAAKAKNHFLWFLHADTRVTQENRNALQIALEKTPEALHYFDLQFDRAGLTILNAIGANLRSKILNLPYGDQGLCIAKDKFINFPENASYGEDVLFVRKLKQQGTLLNRIPSKLTTSARKYKTQGWLKTTLKHQYYFYRLMREKL